MIPESNIFSLSMTQDVIDYIEENILQELTIAKVAAHFMSVCLRLHCLLKLFVA